jgi:sec-independent protein translocase protein TatB
MFGIGFSELVLIGIILIILIKPEDLPRFFRSVGKIYGRMKGAYNDVISAKEKILKEIDDAVTLEEKAVINTGALKPPDPASKRHPEQPNPEPPEGGRSEVPAGGPLQTAVSGRDPKDKAPPTVSE